MTDLLGGFRKTKGIKTIQIKTMTFTNEFMMMTMINMIFITDKLYSQK